MSGFATVCSDGSSSTDVNLPDTCVYGGDYLLTKMETPTTQVNEITCTPHPSIPYTGPVRCDPCYGVNDMQDVHDEVEIELGRGFSVEALFDYSRLPKEATHYRFCYMKAGMDAIRAKDTSAILPEWTVNPSQLFRLRDERTGNLVLVQEYRSIDDVTINWSDGGSHIFCDGYARVDENGTAWLSEEPFDG